MNCEIEFLPVGEASKGGDAIVVRYGEEQDYRLMLVDGGNAETGKDIVSHLRSEFGEGIVLDDVLLSHADADHASGLREVLKEIPVRNLWFHAPWLLGEEARTLFQDSRWTKDGLESAIRNEYDIVSEIYDLGIKAGCEMYFPFAGFSIGPFRILSPAREVYRYLLPQFDRTPDPNVAAIKAASMWIGKESVVSKVIEMAKAAVTIWTTETWDSERLKDGGVTSASNESSVVLYGDFGNGRRVLLTADAGVNALTWAADNAAAFGLPLGQFSFAQIPHHGSRRNVGPTILDRILGPIQQEGSKSRFAAYVSSPKVEDRHPRRMVLNAFKRRGGLVVKTGGGKKVHWGGFSPRKGYVSGEGEPFYTDVEDYT